MPAILGIVGAPAGEPDWTVEEIVATLTAPNHHSWLAVEPDGSVAAWAYLDNPSRGPLESVEIYGTGAAKPPLLDLAIARAAERAREAGHADAILRATAIASDRPYIAALEAAGFTFVKRHARLRRAMDGRERPRPVDATIRPLRHDHEPELRLFHRVLAEELLPDDFAAWRGSIAALPSVTWDEWFVAEVDGAIVGVLQSSDQGAPDGEGWVKNLAVLRAYRRKGIGTALLMTAFAAYAKKGRKWAGLGVDRSNPTGAHRLYEAVGMTATFEADVYERRIGPGAVRAPHP